MGVQSELERARWMKKGVIFVNIYEYKNTSENQIKQNDITYNDIVYY